MKRPLLILLALMMLTSCNDDAEQRQIENARDQKKKEAVFSKINQAWSFSTSPANPVAASLAVKWAE
jgi:hypothetical protein